MPVPDEDWTEMSNVEMNGSQIPGSADEKVRHPQVVERLEKYNRDFGGSVAKTGNSFLGILRCPDRNLAMPSSKPFK